MSALLYYTAFSVSFFGLSLWNVWRKADGELAWATAELLHSKTYLLIIFNMGINALILCGKLLQYLFFGELTDAESQRAWDRVINYVLVKIVFITAILEPEPSHIVGWVVWFAVLGFLNIFSGLSKDRFRNLTTYTPNLQWSVYARMITLLFSIMFADLAWFYVCLSVFRKNGASLLLLLTFECVTLFLDTIQTLIKYGIHLMDMVQGGTWEKRGVYMYYTEFFTDTMILLATLAHYAQILILHGISLSLVDAIIFLHMRLVFNNLREKIRAYNNYRRIVNNMENRFVEATEEEISEYNDTCAICRETMTSARKLPCGHIFHSHCLRSWLEYHHSCPICRRSILENDNDQSGQADNNQQQPNNNTNNGNQYDPSTAADPHPGHRTLWGTRGGGWFGWLPTFTVEVVQQRQRQQMPFMGGGQQPGQRQAPMNFPLRHRHVPRQHVLRIREVFPNIPEDVIARDLMRTLNVEVTLNNAINGLLGTWPDVPPPDQQADAPDTQPQAAQPSTQNIVQETQHQPQQAPSIASTPSPPPSPSLPPPALSDTFAQTSDERQDSLRRRKLQLLHDRRKAFLQKKKEKVEASILEQEIKTNTSTAAEPVDSKEEEQEQPKADFIEDDAITKRRKAYEAAQRRLTNSQNLN